MSGVQTLLGQVWCRKHKVGNLTRTCELSPPRLLCADGFSEMEGDYKKWQADKSIFVTLIFDFIGVRLGHGKTAIKADRRVQ